LKEAKITISGVPDKPGIASHIFSALADANIVVDMIIQNAGAEGNNDVSFTIPEVDMDKAILICEDLKKSLGAKKVSGSDDIVKVSVLGLGMRSYSGVAAKMFTTLANEGINIEMISTSEIKISCVIGKKYAELAVRALHDAFGLDKIG
jgi:aspartate kinase